MWVLGAVLVLVLCWLAMGRSLRSVLGRRCPRDGSPLERTEALAYGSSVGPDGLSRPAVIEWTYSCPLCDFRHVEALLDPTHRAASLRIDAGLAHSQVRHNHFGEMLRRRRDGAITEEQFREVLASARRRAVEKTSPDSPWLPRAPAG